MPVTSENANKSQGRTVQKPEENSSTQQTVPIKPDSKVPNKMNKGIEQAIPSIEKNRMADDSSEQATKVKETEQAVPSKPNVVTSKLLEGPESLSSNQIDSQAETGSQPRGKNGKSETIIEESDTSISIKTSRSLTLVPKPGIEQENKTPSTDRKIPLDIGIMNNPPQRTQSSGGQSDNQFSHGAGTISFMAYRFNLDEYIALTLIRMYTSRQDKYGHQWINAPPSPPPKAAPFYLTFTVNLATDNDK